MMGDRGNNVRGSEVIGVQVKYFNLVRDATRRQEDLVSVAAGTTVRTLVSDAIVARYQGLAPILLRPDGAISPHTRFFRNGTLLRDEDLDTALRDGDEVCIFPAVAGG